MTFAARQHFTPREGTVPVTDGARSRSDLYPEWLRAATRSRSRAYSRRDRPRSADRDVRLDPKPGAVSPDDAWGTPSRPARRYQSHWHHSVSRPMKSATTLVVVRLDSQPTSLGFAFWRRRTISRARRASRTRPREGQKPSEVERRSSTPCGRLSMSPVAGNSGCTPHNPGAQASRDHETGERHDVQSETGVVEAREVRYVVLQLDNDRLGAAHGRRSRFAGAALLTQRLAGHQVDEVLTTAANGVARFDEPPANPVLRAVAVQYPRLRPYFMPINANCSSFHPPHDQRATTAPRVGPGGHPSQGATRPQGSI